MSALNKKAAWLTMGTIITIALLTVSLVLIGGVWKGFISKAEPKAAESLCKSFNAARLITQTEILGVKGHLAPSACNPIDKKELPSKEYSQDQEGLKANIADLTAKCWNIYLEGREKNMFAKNWPFGNDACNICYTFSVKKGIIPVTTPELELYLTETTYLAEDTSDKCAVTNRGYEGGYCMDECNEEYPKEKRSTKCKNQEKPICCTVENKKDECVNNGGACRDNFCNEDELAYLYPKGWQCADKDKICCLNKDNVYSYMDYIQFYEGTGKVMYHTGIQFANPEQYAITLVSPKDELDLEGWTTLSGGALATAGAVYLASGVATGGVTLVIGGIGLASTLIATSYSLEEPDMNAVLITPLNFVSRKCSIQE